MNQRHPSPASAVPSSAARRRPRFMLRPVSLAACLLVAAPASFGLPQGATANGGQASVSLVTPTQMQIDQTTQRAGLDWTSFSIAAGERVNISQPSARAVLINRVVGNDPSQIHGALSSNGQVWLVNPRGIYFGAGSQVDVGGLVATTLALGQHDIDSGRLQLGSPRADAGELRAEGSITAIDGSVLLVAPRLLHSGRVQARRIGLAAASEVLVDVEGDGLVFFNARNDDLGARLSVLGNVLADGGTAELRAAARAGFADTVLNLEGVVRARSLASRNGRIVVDGGSDGITRVAGTLDAAGPVSGQTGGDVLVLGDKVMLDTTAVLDAAGAAGGGRVRVGGGYQGADTSLRNADMLVARAGSRVDASATEAGDGGQVVLWADGTTRFHGSLVARGGPGGGRGGDAEVSGRHVLDLQGDVDLAAPAGAGGHLLLDPLTITVSNAAGLISGDIDFADTPDATTINNDQLNARLAGFDVTLEARQSITISAPVSGAESLTLRAGGNVDVEAEINIVGALMLSANDVNAPAASRNPLGRVKAAAPLTAAGGLTITNHADGTGTHDLQGNLSTGGVLTVTGHASLTGAAVWALTGAGTTSTVSGNLSGAGSLTKSGAGALRLEGERNHAGATTVSGGTLRLGAGGSNAANIVLGGHTLEIAGGVTVNNLLTVADNATVRGVGTGIATLGTPSGAGAVTLALAADTDLNLDSVGGGADGSLVVSRQITGAADSRLTVTGSSPVTLAANNTYGGGTAVDSGTLRVSGATATAGSGAINLGARTLDIAGGASVTNTLSIADGATITNSVGTGTLAPTTPVAALAVPANGTLVLSSSAAAGGLTVSRAIAGAAVTKRGSGAVVLSGNNSFTGPLQIDAGTLRLQGGNAVQNGVAVTLADAAGALLGLANDETIGSLAGGGADGGNVALGNSKLTLSGNAGTTFAGVIADAGAGVRGQLDKQGNGILTLSGANTYGGTTTVGGGTLRISGTDASAGTGTIALGARTLDIAGGAIVTNTLTVADNATITNSSGSGRLAPTDPVAALVLANNSNLNLSSTATGANAGLTIAREMTDGADTARVTVVSGSVTLTAANSYDGGTAVDGGTLRISGATANAGSGTIALGARTLDIAGGAIVTNTLTVADNATITNSSGSGRLDPTDPAVALTLADDSNLNLSSTAVGANTGLTIARAMTDGGGTARVTVLGGSVTLTAANSYDGGTAVSGGSLRISGVTASAGTGPIELGARTLDIAGGATVTNALTVGDGATLTNSAGSGTLGPGNPAAALLVPANGTLVLSSSAAPGGGLTVSRDIEGGAVTKRGDGTVVLSGDNGFTGALQIDAGTLLLQGGSAVQNGVAVTLANAATARLELDDDETIGSLAGGGALGGNVALGTSKLTLAGDASTSFGGIVSDGGPGIRGQIDKQGSGTLTLTRANTYGGTTTVSAGTLRVSGAAASAGSGTIALGGRTLDIAGGATVTNRLTIADGATVANSAGTGVLDPTGNPVTDLAVPANGTLILSSSAGGLTVNRAIEGGAVTKRGAGSVVLAGHNTFTGPLQIDAGTLFLQGGSAVHDAVAVTLANAATALLELGSDETIGALAGGGSAGGNVALGNAKLTLSGNAGTTFAGVIADAGAGVRGQLDKQGNGILTLSGANTYGGTTTVGGGTLRISGTDASAGTGTIALGARTLDIAGGATVTNTLDVANNATITNSSGSGRLAPTDPAAALVLADNSNLNLSSTATGANAGLTIAREMTDGAGTAGVTVQGGTVTFTAAHSYDGGTAVDGGTLRISGATANAGSGTIALGARTLDIAGGAIVTNTLTVADNATITNSSGSGRLDPTDPAAALVLADNSNLNLSSTAAGANGGLTIARTMTDGAGPGRLTVVTGNVALAADNSYSGGTTIDDGATLHMGTGASTGSLGNGDIVNNGTLRINRDSALVAWLDQDISGDGAVVQAGTGTAVLSGSNTYSGGTTIDSGVLQLGNAGATGTAGSGAIVNNATLAVNRGGTLTLAQDISGSGALTLDGGGTTVLTGNNSYGGLTTINALTTLQLGDGGAGGTLGSGAQLTNHGTLRIARDASAVLTLDQRITGNGGLVQAGAGTTALTGANDYVGGTRITGGTLRISGPNATAGTGSIELNDKRLDIAGGAIVPNAVVAGANATILSSSGGGTLASGQALTLAAGTLQLSSANGGTLLVDRVMADNGGAVAVTVSGAAGGVVTLARDNTHSGLTTINTGGTLQLGAGGATGALGGGPIVDNGTLRVDRNNLLTLAGNISGSGTLVQAGTGITELTGANSYGGTTTVGDGTLRISGAGAAGTGTIILNDNVLDIADGATVANAVNAGAGAAILNSSGGGTLGGAGGLTLAAGNLSLSSTATGAGAGLTMDRALADAAGGAVSISVASGTVTLARDNSYSGGSTVGAGATLRVGSGGHAGTLGSGSVVANGALRIDRDDAGTVVVANPISGAGSLALDGSATVLFSAANTFSGGTTVNGGTLAVHGNDASVGSGAIVLGTRVLDIGDGAVVANPLMTSGGATITNSSGNGSLAGPGSLTPGAGALVLSSTGAGLTIDRALTDGGGPVAVSVAAGAGPVTLARDNGYTGTTTIASGATLQLGHGGTSGTLGSGAVVNDGILRIDRSDSLTLAVAIVGSGSLVQAGTGTTVLTAAHGYGGDTTVDQGTLRISGNGAAGSGAILLNAGDAVLDISGGAVVANHVSSHGGSVTNSDGDGTLTGALTLAADPATRLSSEGDGLTIGGAIADGGLARGIEKTGPGHVTLAGDNRYGGRTLVSAGTLRTAAADRIADTSPLVVDGGSFVPGGDETIASLAGTGGSVVVDAPHTLRIGAADVATTYGGVLAGSGQIEKIGSNNSLTLGGAGANTGTLTVKGGTLALAAADALGRTSRLVVDGGSFELGTHAQTLAGVALLDGSIGGGAGSLLTSTSSFDLRKGTVGAPLGGAADVGVQKTTDGTVTLSGPASYGGPTTLAAGTLVLAVADAVPATTALLITDGVFDIGSLGVTVRTLALQGGSIVGTGTLTATAVNGYQLSGGTITANLGSGGVQAGGSTTLTGRSNASTLNIAADSTLTLAGSNLLAAPDVVVHVAKGGTLINNGDNQAERLNLAGDLGGTGILTATDYMLDGGSVGARLGAGSLTSAGASRIDAEVAASAIRVDNGRLDVGHNGRFTNAAARVTVARDTELQLATSQTIDRLTLSGSLGAAPGSSPTLTAKNYQLHDGSAHLALGGGALNASGDSSLNADAAIDTLIVDSGNLALKPPMRLTAMPAVTVARDATLELGGDQAIGLLNGDADSSVKLASFTLSTGSRGPGTFNGVLSGSGTLHKVGAGHTFTLGGDNQHALTRISEGTLTLAADERLADDSRVEVAAGATLQLAGKERIETLLLLDGTVAAAAGADARLTAADYTLRGGTVAAALGGGTLTSTGSTVLRSPAAVNRIDVDAGTLTLHGELLLTALPAVSVARDALLALKGSQHIGTLSGPADSRVTLDGHTLGTGSSGDSSFAGELSGGGSLVKQGKDSSFTLGGDNKHAMTRVDAGRLVLAGAERLADGSAVEVARGAELRLGGGETIDTLLLEGTLTAAGTDAILHAATYTLRGGIVDAPLGAGELTSSGESSLNATAAAGKVTVTADRLTLGGAQRLTGLPVLTVEKDAELRLGGNDTASLLVLRGDLTGADTLTATEYQLRGGAARAGLGRGALNSEGGSTLAGSAAVDSIHVLDGNLQLVTGQQLTRLPLVTVDEGAWLTLAADQSFGTLTGGGRVQMAGFTLASGAAGDSTFEGVLDGDAASVFVKRGASVFTLEGNNTWLGRTVIDEGTLRVGNHGASGTLGGGDIEVRGTLQMARSDDVTLLQAISGSGQLEQQGAAVAGAGGRLTLDNGNNAYTGATRVTGGELATSGADKLPDASAVTVAERSRLLLGGRETVQSLSADGQVELAGDLQASGDLLLRGAVTGRSPASQALTLSGNVIDAVNPGNRWNAPLSFTARDRITLSSGIDAATGHQRPLELAAFSAAAGGRIDAGQTAINGNGVLSGGQLIIASDVAQAVATNDTPAAAKRVQSLPVAYTADGIVQGAGSRLEVGADAELGLLTPNGASIQVGRLDNVFSGRVSAIAGSATAPWTLNGTTTSLQNRVRIGGTEVNVGGAGVVGDIVDINADTLATRDGSTIVARLPFDRDVGTTVSLPALTLTLTDRSFTLTFPYGNTGVEGLHVNVGSRSWGPRTTGPDAGYITVLPRGRGTSGTTSVLLVGPHVNAGGYGFFFDGASIQGEVPVYYNGVLPATPQVESSISATVAVSEVARKQRFDEAVRTENVALRLRAGVIAEVGPAPSATQGPEGARLPASCAPAAGALNCAAQP